MTRRQIEWAKQHDWFIRAGIEYVIVRDFTPSGAEVDAYFDNFAKLRAWAGY